MSIRKEILESTIELAKESYKEHKIAKQEKDRWIIAREIEGKTTSVFKTEIIALYNNSLYIGGDIDVVVFSYGPSDPIERLKWIGYTNDYAYVAEKARIGTSRSFKEYDEAVAKQDLLELMENHPKHAYFLEDHLDKLYRAEFVVDEIYNGCSDIDIEELEDFGKVLSSSVVYAKEAVNKLCQLLEGEEKSG